MMQDHVTQDSPHGGSAEDNAAKLARMASQIATFFQSYPETEAVPAIADHINQFWSRRMREDFLSAFDANSEAIHPLVRKAITSIRQARSRD